MLPTAGAAPNHRSQTIILVRRTRPYALMQKDAPCSVLSEPNNVLNPRHYPETRLRTSTAPVRQHNRSWGSLPASIHLTYAWNDFILPFPSLPPPPPEGKTLLTSANNLKPPPSVDSTTAFHEHLHPAATRANQSHPTDLMLPATCRSTSAVSSDPFTTTRSRASTPV